MPYKPRWLEKQELRPSAVLTNDAYVVSTNNAEIRDCNQIILYIAFTIGSLTSAEVKVEFSSDNTNWYQEASQVSAGGGTFTQNPVVHKYTASGNKRLPIPVADRYVRVSCKGTGTVTDSLMAVEIQLGSSS